MSDDGPIRWEQKTAFVMPILPPELKVDPVLAGLLHCVAFLELSGDETVDPDWAIEAVEHVGAYLQRLTEEETDAIEKQLAAVSAYAHEHGAPDRFIEFIDDFLDGLGLEETSDEQAE